MADQARIPVSVEICPHCSHGDQLVEQYCRRCHAYINRVPWAGERPKIKARPKFLVRRRTWALLGIMMVFLGVVSYNIYPFFPDPLTLMFKRPTTSATSSSLPGQWSMQGRDVQLTGYVADAPSQPQGRVAWSVDLGEPTRSAPVIVDGVIYVGGYFKAMALDAESGRTIWEVETPGVVDSSPAVAGDMLYLGFTDWRVVALDLKTGQQRWDFKTGGPVVASVSVANGIAYVGSQGGGIYALDAATGRLIWKLDTDGQIFTPPAIYEGKLFAKSTDGNLYSLNARTGQRRLRVLSPWLWDSLVAANGLVYVATRGDLFAVDAAARELPFRRGVRRVWLQLWLWRFPVSRPPGEPGIIWGFRPEKSSEGIFSSPAVAPEALYVGDLWGNFYAVDALDGTELWRFQAGGAIRTPPIIVGQRVYVGVEDGVLYALDRSKGEVTWRRSFDAPINVPPVFAEDRLYVRTNDGLLHAIE